MLKARSREKRLALRIDDWLVQTVGVLLGVIGITLLVGARRAQPMAETLVLASGAAIGVGGIDVVFVLVGRISAIYLADAAVELFFLGAALWAWLTSRRSA